MSKDKVATPTNKTVANAEPVYSASEIAANARRLFGCGPDIASAALACSNITDCTVEQARAIIKKFAERKVNN